MRHLIAISAAMLLCGGPAFADANKPGNASEGDKPVKLRTENKAGLGEYLTDARGRALYVFMADKPGVSTCKGDCAKAWPPLMTAEIPQSGEADVDKNMIGLIDRDKGSRQVTYTGWPLYYYAKDQKPGSTRGQHVEGFGAEWYLLAPNGKVIKASADKTGDAGKSRHRSQADGSKPARHTTTAAADVTPQVMIEGQPISSEDVIGLSVVTSKGDHVGEAIGVVERSNRPNGVVVRVQTDNLMLTGEADEEPTVLGGRTVAIGADNFRRASGREALVITPEAMKAGSIWFVKEVSAAQGKR